MTDNEALEWFKGFYNGDCERENFEDTVCADCNFPCRHGLPILRAISALEEIQHYRAIGTVSEFRELKEKATAIKSDGFSDHLLNMGYTKGMKDGYAKAIEEFAEKICDVCCEESMTVILENRVKADVLTLDGLTEIVWEIAKELKGE